MRVRLFCVLLLACTAFAEETYRKPPKEVLDVLHAPALPAAVMSPTYQHMLLLDTIRYPSVAEHAEPMLRLAGLRINPKSSSLRAGGRGNERYSSIAVKVIGNGTLGRLQAAADARFTRPEWSPDGRYFAVTNTTPTSVELWIGEAAAPRLRKITGLRVNGTYGDPLVWMPDSRTLLVQLVPGTRGQPPVAPDVPTGPNVQESEGRGAPVWTYQDLLKNPLDEALFEHYATSQLALVDAVSGKSTPLGQPAIFALASPSPDGKYFLVSRVHKPYSYLHMHFSFPRDVEVWDHTARVAHKLASLPLADAVPVDGVPTGPRTYHWRPTAASTLVWVEALDSGDPKKKVPFRDRLLMLDAPFSSSPRELIKVEQRYNGMLWLEKDGRALLRDYERTKRWQRTFLLNAEAPGEAPRLVWSRDSRDRYRNPGTPIARMLPNGHRAVLQNGSAIFLEGPGSSPEGDRPFLDRLDLQTLRTDRLFRSGGKEYEEVLSLAAADGSRFITRHESPTAPPNYFLRSSNGAAPVQLTSFADPAPQLRRIQRRLVTYKRNDGVQLSFQLYLPPDYKEGTRLPTVVWAYPLEYADADTAGQIGGSTQRFTVVSGTSHLFFLLQGYAVLDNATMPVVGDFETVNNTYIEQVVSSAKAAIDKAVELGVTDPKRVGVGGHSYGAFMTANLLAHCDLFRAGIARSGAYNRTLTPFGFQSERRFLWQAPETYLRMSPFMHADKINEPILLIHGEADNNAGTHPIQSDRMYQAIRGNGGTVRYVTLPFESHGYTARESVEHTLWEMLSWFDRWVKNDPVVR